MVATLNLMLDSCGLKDETLNKIGKLKNSERFENILRAISRIHAGKSEESISDFIEYPSYMVVSKLSYMVWKEVRILQDMAKEAFELDDFENLNWEDIELFVKIMNQFSLIAEKSVKATQVVYEQFLMGVAENSQRFNSLGIKESRQTSFDFTDASELSAPIKIKSKNVA